jgi:hypothetical protein
MHKKSAITLNTCSMAARTLRKVAEEKMPKRYLKVFEG